MIPEGNHRLPISERMIVCDFDGTITYKDAYYELLQRHGKNYAELLEQFQDESLGTRAFIEETFFYFEDPWSDLAEDFDEIELDPHFPDLIELCAQKRWDLWVVSDGFDWWIDRILAHHHIEDIPVCCNEVIFTPVGPRFLYPWVDESCPICKGHYAVCKGYAIRQLRKYTKQVVFVGDGKSDRCALPEADHVFAKDNLLRICQESGQEHTPFHDLGEVANVLQHENI